jgi:hypothetical protein
MHGAGRFWGAQVPSGTRPHAVELSRTPSHLMPRQRGCCVKDWPRKTGWCAVDLPGNLLVALVVTFVGTGQQTARNSPISFNDVDVLAAVYAHPTMVGQMEKWSRSSKIRSPIFLVVRNTVPLCAEPRDQLRPCVLREHFTTLVGDENLQQRLGSAFPATIRQQLASSFEQRNSTSSFLPALPDPRVQFIEYDALVRSFDSGEYRGRARGYMQFSLPAYTADGKALVYAGYSCGGTCGKGFFFCWRAKKASGRSCTPCLCGCPEAAARSTPNGPPAALPACPRYPGPSAGHTDLSEDKRSDLENR